MNDNNNDFEILLAELKHKEWFLKKYVELQKKDIPDDTIELKLKRKLQHVKNRRKWTAKQQAVCDAFQFTFRDIYKKEIQEKLNSQDLGIMKNSEFDKYVKKFEGELNKIKINTVEFFNLMVPHLKQQASYRSIKKIGLTRTSIIRVMNKVNYPWQAQLSTKKRIK